MKSSKLPALFLEKMKDLLGPEFPAFEDSYEKGERPGKHLYYYAGLYYIQEPSAMALVELLDVQSGDRIVYLIYVRRREASPRRLRQSCSPLVS